MKNALKIIAPYLVVAALAAALAVAVLPKRVVTVHVEAKRETVDSLAAAAFEIYKSGAARVFEQSSDYAAHVDSIVRANRRVVRVPVTVFDTLTMTVRDTVIVIRDEHLMCVPIVSGAEFRARFEHAFEYPEGDSTRVLVSLSYSQPNWPLHAGGAFKDFSIVIPAIERSAEIRDTSFLRRSLSKALYFSAGLTAGYLAAR